MKKTRVVFRKWRENGDIIALFVRVPACVTGALCSSYEHVGQHGPADYDLVLTKTTHARPEDYADLQRELEALGYDLEVHTRQTASDFDARHAEARRQLQNAAIAASHKA